MTVKINIPSATETVHEHARRGWQCPECYGVQITTRKNRFVARIDGFQCEECGCNWGEDY